MAPTHRLTNQLFKKEISREKKKTFKDCARAQGGAVSHCASDVRGRGSFVGQNPFTGTTRQARAHFDLLADQYPACVRVSVCACAHACVYMRTPVRFYKRVYAPPLRLQRPIRLAGECAVGENKNFLSPPTGHFGH